MRRHTIRFWGLPGLTALATMLVAATVDPSGNWARLKATPPEARKRLVENLQKFDLVYSTEQQQKLRELDRQINELEPARQAQYLAALERYHNWLDGLPEIKQDAINAKAPGERMDLINKLIKDHPVSRASTARFLQLVDVGDNDPFELAAIYQIWQSMPPAERQKVENMQPGPRRKSFLGKGEASKITAALKRQQFEKARWISEFEAYAASQKGIFTLQELKARDDARPGEILLTQAINFHFLENHPPKPVDVDRLDDFLASFPPWLQSCFDHHSPDEAKRRLTVVYRLVFPAGHEMKESSRRAAPAAGTGPRPAPSRGGANPAAKSPSATGTSPF